MAERALLFLDVDGTLLPGGGEKLDATLVDWQEWQSPRNPRLARMNRTHGERLLSLDCDLIWATAWMHHANEVIAPLLGLPHLAVADLPEAPLEDPVGTLHWKTAALVAAANGRRFIWLDDEISDLDRAWVDTHHKGSALLHRVDSRSGLVEADLAVVSSWLLRQRLVIRRRRPSLVRGCWLQRNESSDLSGHWVTAEPLDELHGDRGPWKSSHAQGAR